MKFQDMFLVAALTVTPSAAMAQDATPQAAQPVVVAAEVAQCLQAQAVVTPALESARARLEMARQTNSPAAMRAAVDALDAVLRDVRTQLEPCGRMSASAAGPMVGHVMPTSSPDAAAPPRAAASTAPKQAATPTGQNMPGHNMAAIPPPASQKPAAPPRGAAKPAQAPTGQNMASMPGHNMANMPTTAGAKSAAVPSAAESPIGPEMTTAANPAARLADLMCQPPVDPKTAPRATYRGKAYYFCSTADRDLFLKAPARYLQR